MCIPIIVRIFQHLKAMFLHSRREEMVMLLNGLKSVATWTRFSRRGDKGASTWRRTLINTSTRVDRHVDQNSSKNRHFSDDLGTRTSLLPFCPPKTAVPDLYSCTSVRFFYHCGGTLGALGSLETLRTLRTLGTLGAEVALNTERSSA